MDKFILEETEELTEVMVFPYLEAAQGGLDKEQQQKHLVATNPVCNDVICIWRKGRNTIYCANGGSR